MQPHCNCGGAVHDGKSVGHQNVVILEHLGVIEKRAVLRRMERGGGRGARAAMSRYGTGVEAARKENEDR